MSEEQKTEEQGAEPREGISRDGITRRDFLKNAAAGAAGVAAFAALGGCVDAQSTRNSAASASTGSLVGAATQDTTPVSNPKVVYPIPNTAKKGGSKVYFTTDISATSLVKVFQALNIQPASGDKTAVKISTGEPPHSNYLRPELIGALVQSLKADIIEDNTAYPGRRHSTASHYNVIKDHGYEEIATCKILEESSTIDLPVVNAKRLPYDRVGAELNNYQFLVNLAHFKGHQMAGFGGVLKNQSIGIASVEGKELIHRGGAKAGNIFNATDSFREAMAEAAQAVHNHFGAGKIVYINVMNRLSIDCDCNGNPAEPVLNDIGICASADPVACDKACLDFVYGTGSVKLSGNNGPLMNRIQQQNGYLTVVHAEEIGLGSQNYEIVNI
jgi:uncharacterized Fe-S center protein